MKNVTWTRPHLTYFGKVAVLPGTHSVEDAVAAEVKRHWSAERALKAGILVIEEIKKAEAPKPATAPEATGKTVADMAKEIAGMEDMGDLRTLFETDERKGIRDAVRARMKAIEAANQE